MSAVPFLAAIRATPDDDAPRLVYADWLDEQGQLERAEFVRVQCELARRESASLRAREAALLAEHHDTFAGPLARPGIRYRFRRGFVVGFGHTGAFVRDRLGTRSRAHSFFVFCPGGRWANAVGPAGPEEFVEMLRSRPPLVFRPADDTYDVDAFDYPAMIRFHRPADSGQPAWTGRFTGSEFLLDILGDDFGVADTRAQAAVRESLRKRYIHTPVDGFDSFDDP